MPDIENYFLILGPPSFDLWAIDVYVHSSHYDCYECAL